jgi:hypothetical protein
MVRNGNGRTARGGRSTVAPTPLTLIAKRLDGAILTMEASLDGALLELNAAGRLRDALRNLECAAQLAGDGRLHGTLLAVQHALVLIGKSVHGAADLFRVQDDLADMVESEVGASLGLSLSEQMRMLRTRAVRR